MNRLFFLFLFFVSGVALGQKSGGDAPASTAELIPENKAIAPGGTFTFALKLDHPAEWHSYYQNSGGVELPPTITWKLPEGFTAGPIQWPVPEVKDGYFGKSFVYSGSPVFLVNITAPDSLKVGESISIGADATWQICKTSCISENESFTLSLPVGGTAEKDPAKASLFEAARKSQPARYSGLAPSSASPDGDNIALRVPVGDNLQEAPVDFIPDQPFVLAASSGGSIARDGDTWVITLKRATKDILDNDIPQGSSFSGILTGPGGSVLVPETVISTSTTAASAPATKAASAPASASSYLKILWGMFFGGLLLNLMPCVFPVIGLKIMGFVQQAGSNRKKIALHGVAFTGGVLVSFGVISGILFAARAAADSSSRNVGWGYQLENPWVVLTLMIVMFILALNMFGIFEIGASATSVGGSLQAKQGIGGSFFSGVLATVVATPCSAPFLGVAIGAAVALPAVQFFVAFGAMAIGLSLPYLVLSVFPKLIDYLPRPGAWMESFKQGMSFLLFATAGYLLWVYAGQIKLDNMLGPIFGLSAIAAAAWVYGRWNLPHRTRGTRLAATGAAILLAIAGLTMAKPPVKSKSALTWEPWSQERVDALLAEGKPVYIDFTAQWCLTCQVNKKTAYTKEVIALMQKKGVVALKADKTSPSPEIDAKLQELGRTAIPVNVLLVPDKKPVITPELLTSGYLSDLFSKEIPAN